MDYADFLEILFGAIGEIRGVFVSEQGESEWVQ
jgi:hypothetical protein